MEYILIIDKDQEEKLTLVVKERTKLVDDIEKLLDKEIQNIYGYTDREIIKLDKDEISCIFTDDNKVYIYVGKTKYLIKYRIKEIEEILDSSFIKINQGCIVNIKNIKKFSSSVGGSIKVTLKNGFEDYISRRELTKVKRSLGIWKNI